jgi:drug/metabolite transporter (DMT)-like permease
LSITSPATSSQPRYITSWLLLILANILWATSYVTSKFALNDVSVIVMLALRMGISAIILLPFLWIRRRELLLTRQGYIQLALLALVGFVINKLCEFGGLALTTASDVALLISSESIFTAALSWILLRERFKKTTFFALLLGFVGVYLIIGRSWFPQIPAGGDIWRIVGDLLVIVALTVEAFYTVRGKSLLIKHSPLVITAASIVGSLFFWGPVAGGEVLLNGWQPISPIGWLSIVWLALMATVIAYLAWFKGLVHVDGSAAAATLFIQPLLGTLLAVVFLQDQLTPLTIVGAILIVISVYLISRY